MTKAYSAIDDNDGRCESCDDLKTVGEIQVPYPVFLGGGVGWGTMWLCAKCVVEHSKRDEGSVEVQRQRRALSDLVDRWVSRGRWSEELRSWWQSFWLAWKCVGRPFSKCVFCDNYKVGYFPGEKFEPKAHCINERTVALVYSFPILKREAPGLTPWEPEKWARWWRTSGAQTSGSRHAVAFILAVWAGYNSDYWKRRGYSFDLVRAWSCWDDRQRGAFLRWAQSPWWA